MFKSHSIDHKNHVLNYNYRKCNCKDMSIMQYLAISNAFGLIYSMIIVECFGKNNLNLEAMFRRKVLVMVMRFGR